ncbi:hypothetical protein QNN87_26220, partial [Citrobacter sp. C411]
MNKPELTDEKIKRRINDIEGRRSASRDFWDGDYEYPEDIELLALRELQERRKADSEPVGIFAKRNGTWLELCSGDTFEHPDAVKLFAATPAPVVPDEKPMPEASKMHAIDAVAAIAEVRGWNACRAAMFQAGNSPV